MSGNIWLTLKSNNAVVKSYKVSNWEKNKDTYLSGLRPSTQQEINKKLLALGYKVDETETTLIKEIEHEEKVQKKEVKKRQAKKKKDSEKIEQNTSIEYKEYKEDSEKP